MKIQGKSYEDNRPLAQLTSSKQSEEDKEHKTTAHPGLAECRERSNIIVYGSSAEIEHTCDLNIISAAKQITFEPATVVEKSKQAGCFFDPLLLNKILKPTKQNFPFTSPLLPIKHLEYGKIFHKILEDAAKINNFSQASKHPYINNLPLPLQEKILHNLEKLLNNPEFMTLASQELKTEVTIGINFNGEIKIGRIDLLAISNGKVTIIDYKTDALPPKRAGLINEAYIDQLNFYHHLVEKLYPDKEITCKILWLEDGSLMNIAR
ncbi:PD-(D/E)XK nuclease family protein [Candidatus Tisiphia endosymbiont of Beris chalybata]|uniref:PD-(D/E)XK nuclease family protein n=1 Tax=Candidatus Tisiphia endosymbiont of Beris chalybata TaxID=3066262 RepID=UPI00312C86EE